MSHIHGDEYGDCPTCKRYFADGFNLHIRPYCSDQCHQEAFDEAHDKVRLLVSKRTGIDIRDLDAEHLEGDRLEDGSTWTVWAGDGGAWIVTLPDEVRFDSCVKSIEEVAK